MAKSIKRQNFFNLLLLSTIFMVGFALLVTNPSSIFSTLKGDISAKNFRQATSGIVGKILIGPTSPICRTGGTCYKAYQAQVEVQTTGGEIVTRFNSGKQGEFKVNLDPGTYVLVPQTRGNKTFPRASQQTVTVAPNSYTSVTIIYDTGLR